MEPRLKPAVSWELRCKAPGGSATRGIQGAGSCTVLGSLDRHDSPRNGCNPPSSLKPPKKCSQKCSYFRGWGPESIFRYCPLGQAWMGWVQPLVCRDLSKWTDCRQQWTGDPAMHVGMEGLLGPLNCSRTLCFKGQQTEGHPRTCLTPSSPH